MLIAMQTFGMYSTKLIVPSSSNFIRIGRSEPGALSASLPLAFLPFIAFVAL